jgi:hypothetical protein
MSRTRLADDPCAYAVDLRMSLGPGSYQTQNLRTCAPCFPQSPHIRVRRGAPPPGMEGCSAADIVDIDSELLGITRRASRCPSTRYQGQGPAPMPCHQKAVASSLCDPLAPEETRLSNPPCTLRCRGWNRWEFLCRNPQDKVLPPFEHDVSYRLVVKDNHRPCVTQPMDQTNSLPPPNAPCPVEINPESWACGTEEPGAARMPSVTWVPCSRFY